jgi:hypothetical protein
MKNRDQIFKTKERSREGESSNIGGSSGSFFFFTQDNKCIVKTITVSERKLFLRLIGDFISNYKSRSASAPPIMAQIYGIYEFKMSLMTPVNLMVMRNSI